TETPLASVRKPPRDLAVSVRRGTPSRSDSIRDCEGDRYARAVDPSAPASAGSGSRGIRDGCSARFLRRSTPLQESFAFAPVPCSVPGYSPPLSPRLLLRAGGRAKQCR